MTTAILHHNLRGSGREVVLELEAAGLALSTETGGPIAVWPFPALTFVDSPRTEEVVELRISHDDIHYLRVFGKTLVEQIVDRSPSLSAQESERRTDKALDFWKAVPEEGQFWIVTGNLIAIVGSIIWIVDHLS